MEIERKWLFDMNVVPIEEAIRKIGYVQTYLSTEPELRIRKKTILEDKQEPEKKGSISYAMTVKGNGTICRHEIQKEITAQEYLDLLDVGRIKSEELIHKEYYVIPVDGYLLTVGIVNEGTMHEFSYGEIEFESVKEAEEYKPPIWFGKDVTGDSSYKMKNYWKLITGRE